MKILICMKMKKIIKIKQFLCSQKNLPENLVKVFHVLNIWHMITFYKEYGSVQTLSERLSWSHYCELLSISDKDKRHFYEVECANSRWSVREL